MASKRHTIIVVPHGRARFRKFRISKWQINTVLLSFVLLTGVAAFSTSHYFSDHQGAAELRALREENAELRQTNRSFDESARLLQEQLSRYEDRTQELAIIAGVEQVTSALDNYQPSTEIGIGGSGSREDLLLDLPAMAERVQRMGTQLDLVDERFTERRLWISSRPAIMPVKGIFTSPYGYRLDPVTGLKMFHRGIDLSAPAGNTVRVTADGIVVHAAPLGLFGRAVFVAHGFGYSTRYAHLSQIDVKAGQQVERGDILGRVGRSGRATGYHVHYEVHENGRTKNPLEFILDATRRP